MQIAQLKSVKTYKVKRKILKQKQKKLLKDNASVGAVEHKPICFTADYYNTHTHNMWINHIL